MGSVKRCIEEFEILHGDHHGLPDTINFLRSLAELDVEHDSGHNTEKHKIREFGRARCNVEFSNCSLLHDNKQVTDVDPMHVMQRQMLEFALLVSPISGIS
ncbi:hypothetical protein MKW98_021215 [Papaver atlanticum]|uniref:Uncharacterized protein n=1 Tax=Papaver atlanticum TaxID=357466 RepID=A0AAD4S914_9MAGN|nr:hypothetical protein MKW98_021215 [Papaver atlanticum]